MKQDKVCWMWLEMSSSFRLTDFVSLDLIVLFSFITWRVCSSSFNPSRRRHSRARVWRTSWRWMCRQTDEFNKRDWRGWHDEGPRFNEKSRKSREGWDRFINPLENGNYSRDYDEGRKQEEELILHPVRRWHWHRDRHPSYYGGRLGWHPVWSNLRRCLFPCENDETGLYSMSLVWRGLCCHTCSNCSATEDTDRQEKESYQFDGPAAPSSRGLWHECRWCWSYASTKSLSWTPIHCLHWSTCKNAIDVKEEEES